MSIKIPIFEEIPLNEMALDKLTEMISETRIGKVPCYINLIGQKKEEMETLILKLEQIILENSVHPYFPYPLYIVSSYPIKSIFPWVKTVKELPEHYFKKVKRPNNKELQLLNILSLKIDKIKNLDLYTIIDNFKESSIGHKKLYLETKELYFLEVLYTRLISKTKGLR